MLSTWTSAKPLLLSYITFLSLDWTSAADEATSTHLRAFSLYSKYDYSQTTQYLVSFMPKMLLPSLDITCATALLFIPKECEALYGHHYVSQANYTGVHYMGFDVKAYGVGLGCL